MHIERVVNFTLKKISIVEQSINKIELDPRIIVMCDATGIKNVKYWIDRFNLKQDFIITEDLDNIVSSDVEGFSNLMLHVLSLFHLEKITNVPQFFETLCKDDRFKGLSVNIWHLNNYSNSFSWHHICDTCRYEILNTSDLNVLDNEIKMRHMFVEFDIVTDSSVEQSMSLLLQDPWSYHSSTENGAFVKPAEITEGSDFYNTWRSICQKAYNLRCDMFTCGSSYVGSESVLPSSKAVNIKVNMSLYYWYQLVCQVCTKRMFTVNENHANFFLMLANQFRDYHIDVFDLIIDNLQTNIENERLYPF